jgi:hypothetical protein
MVSVVILNVIMLSVDRLSVVAPIILSSKASFVACTLKKFTAVIVAISK